MRYVLTLFGALGLAFASTAFAAGSGSGDIVSKINHEHPVQLNTSPAALQRGARTFVNYCLGCHSAGYHRYLHLVDDLGLTEELVREHLIFTRDADGKPEPLSSLMKNTMAENYAHSVFGTAPPDLTLVARVRNTDWLYAYLRGFYVKGDDLEAGVDNLVFPGVGMPHVLWELQGWREAVFEAGEDPAGKGTFSHFEQLTEGELTESEYDKLVLDLVSFLYYLGDPNRAERYRVGFWVVLGLLLLMLLAYMLKREYWRDVH